MLNPNCSEYTVRINPKTADPAALKEFKNILREAEDGIITEETYKLLKKLHSYLLEGAEKIKVGKVSVYKLEGKFPGEVNEETLFGVELLKISEGSDGDQGAFVSALIEHFKLPAEWEAM